MNTPDPSQLLTPNPGAVAAVNVALTTDTVDPGVADLISQWRTRLSQGYAHDKDARDGYVEDRRVARGESQWLVDTNLVGAILEILAAFTYAKDPDFEVKVSDSVNNTRGKQLKPVTETLRIVVSRLLKDAGLKRQCKRWVRGSQTVGASWLKPSLTTHMEKVSLSDADANTLQDNVARLAVLKENLASGDVKSEDGQRVELEANIAAINAKMERQVADGLALDIFPPDDVQVSPECGELVNYLQAPWIRFRTYKSKEEAQAISGMTAEQIGQANLYTQKLRSGAEQGTPGSSGMQNAWIKIEDGNAQTADGFVAFEEIWSRRDGMVYTLIDGINDRWARPPYAPCTGSRFYDGFLLGCHYIDGDRHPQSDVHQLKKLQDEYGRTRSNFAEHRKRSIPITVWDAAELPDTELKKITSADAHEHVAVNFAGTTGNNMQNRFFRFSGAAIDPAQYTTQPITTDMEKVSGAQDAMQSGVSVEKTATEANIQNNGFGARIGTRRDELEDVLSDIGMFVAQLALLKLPESVVARIAGEDYVWPKLSVDECHSAFNIDVRAGSTGKPNLAAERAAWGTLLPLVEKMITVIGNFRSQGPAMEWAARPYVEMLTTTFEMLGNKDDVEKYLPHPPPPPPPDPMAGVLAALTGAEPAPAPMAPVLDAIGTPPGAEAPTAVPTST